MTIVLESAIYKVTEIKRKTKASMFANLKVGDSLRFSTSITHNTKWSGGGGVYATSIRIEHVESGEYTYKSPSELTNILNGTFEIERKE